MPITRETFTFMKALWDHNNKNWFDRNRERYIEHVREPIKELAATLSVPVFELLPGFSGKPKISKINADIRFHRHKPPYKEHVWVSYFEGNLLPAELFFYIDRQGWGAGVGGGGGKKEILNLWRRNLLEHRDLWRKYARAVGLKKKLRIFVEGAYKKPLLPGIPDDLLELVQAKKLYIAEDENRRKTSPKVRDFYEAMCRVYPVYLFMTAPAGHFKKRMKRLTTFLQAPSPQVAALWKKLA